MIGMVREYGGLYHFYVDFSPVVCSSIISPLGLHCRLGHHLYRILGKLFQIRDMVLLYRMRATLAG